MVSCVYLTYSLALTDKRCGANLKEANGKCGAKCVTKDDCTGGEKCFAGLDLGVCSTTKARIKVFDGVCDGYKVLMFEGGGDNDGTAEERTDRCSNACLSKKKPKYGTWDGFVAKGFTVNPTTGGCYCEASDFVKCKRIIKNGYVRYDWQGL